MKLPKYVVDKNTDVLVPITSVRNHQVLKQYISKKDFDFYYIEKNLTRTELASMGVGSKCFQNSYHKYYPNSSDRARIKAAKSRRHKMGNTYGSSSNSIKLRKTHIVNKEELLKLLNKGETLCNICKHFSISEPTLNKNIQYHNIDPPAGKHIHFTTYLILRDLERLTNIDFIEYLKPSVSLNIKNLRNDVYMAELAIQKCKETLAALRYRMNLGASAIPRSKYERILIEFLIDYKIEFIPQYIVERLPFDIYLPNFNLLIEVDGKGHNTKSDDIKNSLAETNKYQLLRIDFSKWKTKNNILKKVKSVLLKKLADMGFGTFK